jgi:hypothetical protein
MQESFAAAISGYDLCAAVIMLGKRAISRFSFIAVAGCFRQALSGRS